MHPFIDPFKAVDKVEEVLDDLTKPKKKKTKKRAGKNRLLAVLIVVVAAGIAVVLLRHGQGSLHHR